MGFRKGVGALCLPLGGCSAEATEIVGISVLAASALIAVTILLFPVLRAELERRDHARRMSRRWREEQAKKVRRDLISIPIPKRARRRRGA